MYQPSGEAPMAETSGNYRQLSTQTARWISNSGRRTPIIELMQKCGWVDCPRTHYTKHPLHPLEDLVAQTPRQLWLRLTLRDDYTMMTPEPRLQTCQMGFIWRATQLWNDLPRTLREEQVFPQFQT